MFMNKSLIAFIYSDLYVLMQAGKVYEVVREFRHLCSYVGLLGLCLYKTFGQFNEVNNLLLSDLAKVM